MASRGSGELLANRLAAVLNEFLDTQKAVCATEDAAAMIADLKTRGVTVAWTADVMPSPKPRRARFGAVE